MQNAPTMRLAVISDVHGNALALRAVLRALEQESVTEIICLGDLVGYNAQPREVIQMIRDHGILSVHGNHDLMVLGRLPVAGGPRAKRAIAWTAATLALEDRMFLLGLPETLVRHERHLFVHSAMGDPVLRLKTPDQFENQRRVLGQSLPAVRVCFTGHTHEPGAWELPWGRRPAPHPEAALGLRRDSFYFVNPGSVGEPRGSDHRASFALYDGALERITFHRVPYDRPRLLRENARRGLTVEQASRVRRLGHRALAAARRLFA